MLFRDLNKPLSSFPDKIGESISTEAFTTGYPLPVFTGTILLPNVLQGETKHEGLSTAGVYPPKYRGSHMTPNLDSNDK